MNAIRLVELPSGSIDLLGDDRALVVQFNASCEDALPYCKAVCCKGRGHTWLELEEDEAVKFRHDRDAAGRLILRADGDRCSYLAEGDLCSVHEDKPHFCAAWHCSPGGVGENITKRGEGWALIPEAILP